jgi:membrane protein YdbS with pleckstrin-like domain
VPDVAVAFAVLAILLGAPMALVAVELLLVLAAVAGLLAWGHVRSRRFEVTPTHVRIRHVPFATAELIPLERVRWARGGPLDPKARAGLEVLEMGVAEEAGVVRRLVLVGLREAGEAAAAVLAVRDGRVPLPAA